MNFTDSPFERMMKQVPRQPRHVPEKPRPGTRCAVCSFWNGAVCMGVCYRELQITRTSGCRVPTKSVDFVGEGGATERADFGGHAAEGTERSLCRRGPKSEG